MWTSDDVSGQKVPANPVLEHKQLSHWFQWKSLFWSWGESVLGVRSSASPALCSA